MKAHSIFIATSIVCLALINSISTEKYPFIGKSRADQTRDYYYRRLTFICDRTTFDNNDYLLHGDYSCSMSCFYKSAIREINFENCDQPTIFERIFRDLYNVNDLDMSHLGMTINQTKFLAEPNKLTKINVSYNNIETILNG